MSRKIKLTVNASLQGVHGHKSVTVEVDPAEWAAMDEDEQNEYAMEFLFNELIEWGWGVEEPSS